MEDYGFTLDRIVGSHHVFRAEIGERVWKLVIPFQRPIKTIYVKQALHAVDEISQMDPLVGADDGETEG